MPREPPVMIAVFPLRPAMPDTSRLGSSHEIALVAPDSLQAHTSEVLRRPWRVLAHRHRRSQLSGRVKCSATAEVVKPTLRRPRLGSAPVTAGNEFWVATAARVTRVDECHACG